MGAFGVGSMQGAGMPSYAPGSVQPSIGDFIIVYFLEKQPVGAEFAHKRDEWPFHVTLLTWFSVPNPRELVVKLDAAVLELRPLRAALGKEGQFNETTRITLVKEQKHVQRLHTALLSLVETGDGEIRDKRWIGDAYKAHLTHHSIERTPRKGTKLDITDFSLVRLLPGNTCGVARNFRLGVTP